ncbi:unnamed protein product [Larinioides sclopetarius]|uniref:Uncharacterized protein n=1 Tax=Larinioides sclopetarius TaxID=280406 RepID=A0AAV1ZG61_9ARAC
MKQKRDRLHFFPATIVGHSEHNFSSKMQEEWNSPKYRPRELLSHKTFDGITARTNDHPDLKLKATSLFFRRSTVVSASSVSCRVRYCSCKPFDTPVFH